MHKRLLENLYVSPPIVLVMSQLQTTLALRESVQLAGLNFDTRVDFQNGVVHDVVLLGKHSPNHNTNYTDSAIQDAFKVVEQSVSYIDHPPGESNERSIRENFGCFEGPYLNSAGELCAKKFKYNVRSSFAGEFEWMLKNIPHRIGFSINADGLGRIEPNGSRLVENIAKTHSFDLVDGPATTGGIFNLRESLKHTKKVLTIREQTKMNFDATITTAFAEIAEAVKSGSVDKAGAINAVKNIMKLLGDGETKEPDPEAEADKAFESTSEETKEIKAMEGASKSKYKYVRFLAGIADKFKLKEQQQIKEQQQKELLDKRVAKAKEKISEDLITMVFREQLASAKDDTEVDKLIEDRSQFTLRERKDNPPASTGQTNTGVPTEQQLKELTAKYSLV